jgi:hypothetical protein
MRQVSVLVSAVLAAAVASCAPLRVDGIYTYGDIHAVTKDDIRAAIVECDAHSNPGTKTTYVRVVSHDEIRLYGGEFDGSYAIMKRVGKKWVSGGVVIVHREV